MFNSFQLNFKTKFHNKTPKVFCLTFGVHVILYRDKNKIVITATLCSIRLYSTLAFIFLKFRHLVQEI